MTVELNSDRHRNHRKGVRQAVAYLQVGVVFGKTSRGQFHRCDDLAGIEVGVALRCVARQSMEFRKSDDTIAGGASDMDFHLKDRERDAHVGWMYRDTGLARAQNRMHPVVAMDRRAAAAQLAFVARRRYVLEVVAAPPLPLDGADLRDLRALYRERTSDE